MIAIPPAGARPGATTHATGVRDRIRADLLEGRFRPGARLPIRALMERYAVGQTPLREALNRLVADGLVECRDQRGFVVPEVSAPDLLELTRTRCWLEERALRESMAAATEAWEEGVVLAHHRLARTPRSPGEADPSAVALWEERHRAFHRALLAGCGSRWLLGFCETLTDRHQRYRRLAARRAFPGRDVEGEHADILAAVLGRDAETAVARLVRHHEATAEVILQDGQLFRTEVR